MGSFVFSDSEDSMEDELLDTTERSVFGDIQRWKSRKINTRFGMEEHVPKITGCCIMSNGTVVFCDNANSKVKVLDENQTKIKTVIKVATGDPFDIDSFSKTSAVLSIPQNKAVQFLRIQPGLRLRREISLIGECYGVAVRKKKIYVCIPELGIQIVSKTGEKFTLINCQAVPRYVYVNADAERIYYSCNAGSVCCVTGFGHIMSQDILPNPGSLVADEMNNLLVCNNASREIHKLKPDGTTDKIILYSDASSDAGKFTSMCSNRGCEILILATAAESNSELLVYQPNDEAAAGSSELLLHEPNDEAAEGNSELLLHEPNDEAAEGNPKLLLHESNNEASDEHVHFESHLQGSEKSSGQNCHQRRDMSDFMAGALVGAVGVTLVGMLSAFGFITLRK